MQGQNFFKFFPPSINTLKVNQKQYEEAYDAFTKYRMEKNQESDDYTGVKEADIKGEDEKEKKYRKEALLSLNDALEKNHNPENTWVRYSDYAYWAYIDGSWVELMIFNSDGEMFFYPLDAVTDEDTEGEDGLAFDEEHGSVVPDEDEITEDNTYDEIYTQGFFSYNRQTKKVRHWIRDVYCPKLGELYDELKTKAEEAKNLYHAGE